MPNWDSVGLGDSVGRAQSDDPAFPEREHMDKDGLFKLPI